MEKRILILRAVMLMTLGLLMYQNSWAQEYDAPPVSISKDKVKIGGKVFYSHVVQERQTLYSISKAYNVSIDEIYKYNPAVKENGLKKNDILNIPVVDAPQPQAEPQRLEEPQQQAETQQQVETAPASENTIQNRTHTVKWYEDLASIARKYGVTEEAIIKANGIKDKRIKNRQVLIIPDPEAASAPEAEKDIPVENIENSENVEDVEGRENEDDGMSEEKEETESIETEETSDDTTSFADFLRMLFKPKVNAALILPFKATGSTSSRNHMDFYSGVLLASKELKDSSNIEVNLNVYDMAAGTSDIPAGTLRNSDLIIGPVAPNDITQINTIVGGACPIISPLDQRVEQLAGKHRNIIQVPSSQYSQYTDLAEWIKEDLQPNDAVIVITEKGVKQNETGKTVKSIMNRSQVEFNSFSYSILEGREIQASIEGIMTATGVNRVIIASDSEAFVNDAVRNLNLIVHNKFQIVLYAPAKIRTFDTIEVENFHNTSLHASLTYNIDYDDVNVKKFIRRYRAMFGTEPTQFAFQGYDITKYFATLVARYKQGWMAHLPEEDAQMLQSSFMFRSKGFGGYVNNGIRRIIYGEDYSIEEVL